MKDGCQNSGCADSSKHYGAADQSIWSLNSEECDDRKSVAATRTDTLGYPCYLHRLKYKYIASMLLHICCMFGTAVMSCCLGPEAAIVYHSLLQRLLARFTRPGPGNMNEGFHWIDCRRRGDLSPTSGGPQHNTPNETDFSGNNVRGEKQVRACCMPTA